MKNFKLFSILLLVIFFISCKSDDGIYGDDGLIYSNLITGSTYHLFSAIADKEVDIKGNGNKSRDYYSQLDDCEKSDYLSFMKKDINERENSYYILSGNNYCPNTDKIIDEGVLLLME